MTPVRLCSSSPGPGWVWGEGERRGCKDLSKGCCAGGRKGEKKDTNILLDLQYNVICGVFYMKEL